MYSLYNKCPIASCTTNLTCFHSLNKSYTLTQYIKRIVPFVLEYPEKFTNSDSSTRAFLDYKLLKEIFKMASFFSNQLKHYHFLSFQEIYPADTAAFISQSQS